MIGDRSSEPAPFWHDVCNSLLNPVRRPVSFPLLNPSYWCHLPVPFSWSLVSSLVSLIDSITGPFLLVPCPCSPPFTGPLTLMARCRRNVFWIGTPFARHQWSFFWPERTPVVCVMSSELRHLLRNVYESPLTRGRILTLAKNHIFKANNCFF